jgi:hypothetical protein
MKMKMRKGNAAILGAASALVAGLVIGNVSVVRADVITFADQKDAMIFGTSGNADTGNSSGMGPGMFAGADGSLNKKRSLMQFDVAGHVPAGATVTDVQLTLILGQVAGSGSGGTGGAIPSRTFGVYDLLQPWTEGPSGSPTQMGIGGQGQGALSQVGDSSWTFSTITSTSPTKTGVTWPAGGNFSSTASSTETFSGGSFIVTPSGTTITPGSQYVFQGSQMITDVQNWLDNPSSNDGWLLRALTGLNTSNGTVDLESTATSFLGFWTRDGAAANNNPAMAPMLTVTYTPAPEPASLAMLLLAAPMIVRRRHRAR